MLCDEDPLPVAVGSAMGFWIAGVNKGMPKGVGWYNEGVVPALDACPSRLWAATSRPCSHPAAQMIATHTILDDNGFIAESFLREE
jgi:hypothetical protein